MSIKSKLIFQYALKFGNYIYNHYPNDHKVWQEFVDYMNFIQLRNSEP